MKGLLRNLGVDVFGHGVRIEADDSTYREYAMVEDCGTGCSAFRHIFG